jgi:hypothetical protein
VAALPGADEALAQVESAFREEEDIDFSGTMTSSSSLSCLVSVARFLFASARDRVGFGVGGSEEDDIDSADAADATDCRVERRGGMSVECWEGTRSGLNQPAKQRVHNGAKLIV